MHIGSVRHTGLRGLVQDGDRSGVPAESVTKLLRMIAFLDSMESPAELRGLRTWRVHVLHGGRLGTWSLSVTRNLRLTFQIDPMASEIVDLNLEDYR